MFVSSVPCLAIPGKCPVDCCGYTWSKTTLRVIYRRRADATTELWSDLRFHVDWLIRTDEACSLGPAERMRARSGLTV